MDEQLKALLEDINAMKNCQEETRQEMQKDQEKTRQEMQKGQEETKHEMQKGLENVQKCQEELKNSLEEKINMWKTE
ncbi:hypothetical protein TNCV_424581 [Trichonephila clavipes]|nr:hypothetical protein TNCV_424581 [Trichonephila clavipes]